MSESRSDHHELPVVSKSTLMAFAHDQATDSGYESRIFKFHNNHNHSLMRHIVITAHEQSGGNIEQQMSFVNGARFVLAVLQRQIDSEELSKILQYSDPVNEVEPEVTTLD